MENMNDIVNKLVEDIDVPEDIPVMYEVWAISFDKENDPTGTSMVLQIFTDPDLAVEYAKEVTLAEVTNLAAEEDYDDLTYEAHSISIEVETVVPSDDEDELNMNVGTVYKKRLETFNDTPEFVELTRTNYEILEDGNIQIPCFLLKDYNKNDEFTAIFVDEERSWPITYKIISKTTSGHYICEFV